MPLILEHLDRLAEGSLRAGLDRESLSERLSKIFISAFLEHSLAPERLFWLGRSTIGRSLQLRSCDSGPRSRDRWMCDRNFAMAEPRESEWPDLVRLNNRSPWRTSS